MSDDQEIDFWKIDPKFAHPKAVAEFKYDFIWQCWNDYSPFGNDDGHPVFGDFREWRITHPNVDPLVLLKHIQSSWGVKFADPLAVEAKKVRILLKQDKFSLHTYDQTTIALGFSQIYVEGIVSPHIKVLVSCAIERQLLDFVIKSMWIYPEQRKEHMLLLKGILEKF